MKKRLWSPKRLRKNLELWAQIGADPQGGITRLAFSPEYRSAAQLYAQKLNDAGLSVHVDAVENVVGTLHGKRKDIIMTGSHLDTVMHGGPLDGALGALAALEFAVSLREQGIELENTLQLVAFAAEEGGPFGGTFGSRAMMGLIDTEKPDLVSKLIEVNLSPDDLRSVRVDTTSVRAFLELHIEQGDHLVHENIPVGVVTGIVGITRTQLNVKGESNHAGTTSMATRKDALDAFSRLVCRVNEEIRCTDGLVGTFGVVHVHPNMANIIPGRVEAVLELRHMDRTVIDEVLKKMVLEAEKIKSADFEFQVKVDKGSCQCSTDLVRIIEGSCEKLGVPSVRMVSGAGHDANAVAGRIPVGMIFIPSIDGKSHCPDENSRWQDIVTGCDVYFQTLMDLDAMLSSQ